MDAMRVLVCERHGHSGLHFIYSKLRIIAYATHPSWPHGLDHRVHPPSSSSPAEMRRMAEIPPPRCPRRMWRRAVILAWPVLSFPVVSHGVFAEICTHPHDLRILGLAHGGKSGVTGTV